MRCLIVDDNLFDRELILQQMCMVFGDVDAIEVIDCETLERALARLGEVDVVFTDYYLKWSNGIDILRRIRALAPDVPVIMVSDTGSEEIAAQAMRLGLNDYVLKSHLARLPLAVKECLENVRLRVERRHLEEHMLKTQKMESLGLLVGGIAHDFNNLLTAIMGYARRGLAALEQGQPEPGYFQSIYDRAEQGARLTRQLLAFARGQAFVPSEVNVNDVIANLFSFLETSLGPTIEVSFQPEPDLKAVYADPTRLEQVLMNLCFNARDAMPKGGQLTLATRQVRIQEGDIGYPPTLKPGEYVMLTVTDTGVGMSEEVRSRLFEPFFTTKDVGEGTGLGLAVVYGIIGQHHGFIEVDSVVNQGTTFSIYLPTHEQLMPVTEALPYIGVEETSKGSGLVLIVEDDEDLQLLMGMVLREEGYSVLQARDGEEGFRLFEEHASDIQLIITDVMMPRVKGQAFQEQVWQVRPATRILVISGYQEIQLKQQQLLDGRSAFLQKPFGLEELTAEVRRLLSAGPKEIPSR